MGSCKYPDWEGGLIVGKHKYGKDGYCVFCGKKRRVKDETERAD